MHSTKTKSKTNYINKSTIKQNLPKQSNIRQKVYKNSIEYILYWPISFWHGTYSDVWLVYLITPHWRKLKCMFQADIVVDSFLFGVRAYVCFPVLALIPIRLEIVADLLLAVSLHEFICVTHYTHTHTHILACVCIYIYVVYVHMWVHIYVMYLQYARIYSIKIHF